MITCREPKCKQASLPDSTLCSYHKGGTEETQKENSLNTMVAIRDEMRKLANFIWEEDPDDYGRPALLISSIKVLEEYIEKKTKLPMTLQEAAKQALRVAEREINCAYLHGVLKTRLAKLDEARRVITRGE